MCFFVSNPISLNQKWFIYGLQKLGVFFSPSPDVTRQTRKQLEAVMSSSQVLSHDGLRGDFLSKFGVRASEVSKMAQGPGALIINGGIQNGWFSWKIPKNMDDLGVPLFQEPPS